MVERATGASMTGDEGVGMSSGRSKGIGKT